MIDTPGHTHGHVAYHLPEAAALFVGDTLFSLGCGRLFEGDPAEMWASLRRLAALPPTTRVWCGHEYTAANARFAVTVDPDNPELAARVAEVRLLVEEGLPALPTTIGRELATNPFLRADVEAVKIGIGMAGDDPVAVFAALRDRKNRF
jgi:hydroxyacylglutathione hydrolase